MYELEEHGGRLNLSTAPASRESSLAMRLVPMWEVLGLLSSLLLVMLLIKVYAKLTVGKCKSSVDMSGKTVIITGSNTGIGKETATELARRNARVILACRNQEKAREAAKDILKTTGRQVVCMKLDLCSFDSVREFATLVIASEDRLDVLINNAGMMSPPKREETKDGFEVSFQTNHLGHFLLTLLLLDLLKKSQPSRIVVVGSVGQNFAYLDCDNLLFGEYWFPLLNYCTTKQCNMLFTVELSRRLEGTGVIVNCCHPGLVRSDLVNRSQDIQTWFMNRVLDAYGKVGDSPEHVGTRFRSVETRKKVAEGSILNSPSGARETSNGRWYNRWPEEVGLE
ncbi:hypothetical protein HPB47_002988 [Ixodes persulcatus]|uniref:Uncharacterized protein n=1 Tax=Ixodes persulcatus TaxID=34615 RepID=A0AC60PJP1_IXOPE|nr:hypothetical protein HPB47_002988 [Ixodes persulcatus]